MMALDFDRAKAEALCQFHQAAEDDSISGLMLAVSRFMTVCALEREYRR
ncbi:MAG: hypothetical protein J2P57_04910 [Acidimicrobiaceae bacterium]|nr:hypothetical protein [Acidimicrobiaceae bacterium]